MHFKPANDESISLATDISKGTQIMYVVFGAGGRAGGETARSLLAAGTSVRVVLRRADHGEMWRKRGADVAVADMKDAGSVAAALNGASGAFLLCPPPMGSDPYRDAAVIGAALADGARRAGLRKAVVLSSIGAQHASGTGVIATLHQMEILLAGIAPATAFLRPGYYVESWSEVLNAVMDDGTLPTFIEPDLTIPMVSTIDVGSTAAAILCEEWTDRRVIELSGPADWSARDVADAFSTVLDRAILPVFVPETERAAVYAQAGVPKAVANALLGMYCGLASGRIAREGGMEELRGTTSLVTSVRRIVDNAR